MKAKTLLLTSIVAFSSASAFAEMTLPTYQLDMTVEKHDETIIHKNSALIPLPSYATQTLHINDLLIKSDYEPATYFSSQDNVVEVESIIYYDSNKRLVAIVYTEQCGQMEFNQPWDAQNQSYYFEWEKEGCTLTLKLEKLQINT